MSFGLVFAEGNLTVGGAFSATAWRYRHDRPFVGSIGGPTWHEVLSDVRLIALGLQELGCEVGDQVGVHGEAGSRSRIDLLAAASAGLDVDLAVPGGVGSGGRGILVDGALVEHEELRRRGRLLDTRAPAAFEARLALVAPGAPAVRLGGETFTHADLLRAARSLIQGLSLAPDDHLVADLPLDDEAGHIVGHVAPVLAGVSSSFGELQLPVPSRPTVLVVGEGGAARLVPLLAGGGTGRRRRHRRRLLAAQGLDRCRKVVVVGPIEVRVPDLGGLLPVVVGTRIPGVAGLVTMGEPITPNDLGRPLPGTSVAIGDDQEILVRPGAGPRRREWLATGRRGAIGPDGRLRRVSGMAGGAR